MTPSRVPGPELGQHATAIAIDAVHRAARELTGAQFVTRKSGLNDIVTEHDIAAERVIGEILREAMPDSRIYGEEGAHYDGGGPVTWHVDPIDGTSNYAAGAPLFCLSVGATYADQPLAGVIFDPSRGETFATSENGITLNGTPVVPPGDDDVVDNDSVILTNFPYEGAWYDDAHIAPYCAILRSFRGVRRLGSSALALAWVAAGRAAVCCELRTNPWDHAAGFALVHAAGGTIYMIDAHGAPTAGVSQTRAYIAAGPGFRLEGSSLENLLTVGHKEQGHDG